MYMVGIDEAKQWIARGYVGTKKLEEMIGPNENATFDFVDHLVRGTAAKAQELSVMGRPIGQVIDVIGLNHGILEVIRRSMELSGRIYSKENSGRRRRRLREELEEEELRDLEGRNYSAERIGYVISGINELLELREEYKFRGRRSSAARRNDLYRDFRKRC